MDYLRDPAAIYRASFEAIRRQVDLAGIPDVLHPLVLRLVHSGGMPDIVADLAWGGDPVTAAAGAIAAGAPIYVDASMVAAGIMARHLPAANDVRCTLHDDTVAALAKSLATTRSAAAVELWRPGLFGAVVAIGNAPTALFHLLERLREPGFPRPAAIFGFPVGFVGAAESKQALIECAGEVPYLTLRGRLGGSAYAAAAVNALLLPDRAAEAGA